MLTNKVTSIAVVAIAGVVAIMCIPILVDTKVADTNRPDMNYNDGTLTIGTLYKHEDMKINATQYAVRVYKNDILWWLGGQKEIKVVSMVYLGSSNKVLVVYELREKNRAKGDYARIY